MAKNWRQNKINAKDFTLDGQNYYYIHRHIAHFEASAAVAFFNEQKERNYQIMRNRYMRNYLDNINIDESSLNVLNAAMSEEEIIGNLDDQLLKILNDDVNKAIQDFNFNEKINVAYKSLNNYINKQDVKDLDMLFAQIAAATKILDSSRRRFGYINRKKWSI